MRHEVGYVQANLGRKAAFESEGEATPNRPDFREDVRRLLYRSKPTEFATELNVSKGR